MPGIGDSSADERHLDSRPHPEPHELSGFRVDDVSTDRNKMWAAVVSGKRVAGKFAYCSFIRHMSPLSAKSV